MAPYGMGSRGARGGTAGGGTLYLCALEARAKMLAIAARLLQVAEPTSDAGRTVGVYRVRHRPQQVFAEVARTAYLDPLALPQGMSPGLDFSQTYIRRR